MTEDQITIKNHGINVSVSSLISIFTLAGMGWFILQPVMLSQLSTAMAGEIQDAIELQTKPIIGAFEAIIQSDVNRLKRVIARLEFKEEHKPIEWTEADSDRLSDSKIELETFQKALRELEKD